MRRLVTQASLKVLADAPMFPTTPPTRNLRLNHSKLRPPSSGLQTVARLDFCRRIEEGRANLVLVTAPAGYGKSTAMTLLYRRLVDKQHKVGWLTASSTENDLAGFAQYLWLSLGTVLPKIRPSGAEATLSQTASASITGRPYELLDALSLIDGPLTLFIDDFQCITSAEVLEFVAMLVDRLDDQQKLVIGTRHKTV